MAAPSPVKVRWFQRLSDNAWLARVDTGSGLTMFEAELHCASEYGFPVRCVEETLSQMAFETRKALRRVGAIMPPAQPPPPLTPDQQAWADATATQRLTLLAQRLGFLP